MHGKFSSSPYLYVQLQPDPKVTKPRGPPTPKVKPPVKVAKPVKAPPPSKKKRPREDSVDFSDDGDGNHLAKQTYLAVKLENVLREAIDSLLRIRFSRGRGGDFRAFNFPHDNPFAVRIEKSLNVVPDDYFEKVKTPCDLLKIKDNIECGFYSSFDEFEQDVKLVVSNALEYHPSGSPFAKAALYFERQSNSILSKAKSKL